MFRIGVAKGRIENFFYDHLKKTNYGIEVLNNRGRKLQLTFDDFEVFLIKAKDAHFYLENKIIDIAILGSDVSKECFEDKIFVHKSLVMESTYIVLAGKENTQKQNIQKIATEYPNITKKYFKDVEIVKLHGSTELAAVLNLADAIIDVVETGRTIKENNLVVLEKLEDITLDVIGLQQNLSDEVASFVEKLGE